MSTIFLAKRDSIPSLQEHKLAKIFEKSFLSCCGMVTSKVSINFSKDISEYLEDLEYENEDLYY